MWAESKHRRLPVISAPTPTPLHTTIPHPTPFLALLFTFSGPVAKTWSRNQGVAGRIDVSPSIFCPTPTPPPRALPPAPSIDGYGLPIFQAVSADQRVTGYTSREKPEERRPCLAHEAQHSEPSVRLVNSGVVIWLHLFNAELSLKRYRRRGRGRKIVHNATLSPAE